MSFLKYANGSAPELSESIKRAIEDDVASFLDELCEFLQLHFLFLDFLKKEAPSLHSDLVVSLTLKSRDVFEIMMGSEFAALPIFLADAAAKAPHLHLQLVQLITTESDRVASRALAAPPATLYGFLKFTEEEMPAITQAIGQALLQSQGRLLDFALSHPTGIPRFLAFACAQIPDVAKALKIELAANSERFVSSLAEAPLEASLQALTALRRDIPEMINQANSGWLADRHYLAQQVLAMPLHQAASSLQYLSDNYPDVANGVIASLRRHTDAVVTAFINSSAGPALHYMETVRQIDTAYADNVFSLLEENVSNETITRFVAASSLDELMQFVEYAEPYLPG